MDTEVPKVTLVIKSRKHLAHDLFWWLIGTLSFTVVVDCIMLSLNWIRF